MFLQNTEWRETSPPTEGLSLFVPDFVPERGVEARFASDCSVYAREYDKVMLFGPGDIANAHTEGEYIDRKELELASLMIAQLIVKVESREV
jgi:acetylornithine deacetylase/succinyl-diaminopimelate desuccinylase-like protein